MTSTQVEVYNSELHGIELTDRRGGTMPPAYTQDHADARSVLSAASSASLPGYDDAGGAAGPSSSAPLSSSVPPGQQGASTFYATSTMQVENQGMAPFAMPLPPRPYPIPVYAVDAATGTLGDKLYESIRRSRSSGNCVLFRNGNPDSPVCSTLYRFGPGRPPRICLLGSDVDVSALGTSVDGDGDYSSSSSNEPPPGVVPFEVHGKGPMTRAVTIRTDMGTFEWRHGSRSEKKATGADSLLILEHVTPVAALGGHRGKEVRRRVAQLVRNSTFRTPGTSRGAAGNGGRLMMDLRTWADAKDQKERVEVFVVASCIVMLKREVDRRRRR